MFKSEDPDPEDENGQYPVQRINKRKEKFAIGFRIYEVNSKINRAELGQAQVKLEVGVQFEVKDEVQLLVRMWVGWVGGCIT